MLSFSYIKGTPGTVEQHQEDPGDGETTSGSSAGF